MIHFTEFLHNLSQGLGGELKQTSFLSARCVPGEVLCGLDDSWRSLRCEGPGKERALPGSGVSPRLRGGEAEEPAQPKHKRLYLRANDLPVFTRTRGAVRVPLAQPDAGGGGGVGCSALIVCLCSACILPATLCWSLPPTLHHRLSPPNPPTVNERPNAVHAGWWGSCMLNAVWCFHVACCWRQELAERERCVWDHRFTLGYYKII